MIPKSRIGWTDYSGGDANFIIGCTPVSEGCAHCYGRSWATRHNRDFDQVTLYADKLARLARFNPSGTFKRGPGTKPMVLVCDLSDLFHEDVPADFIKQALDVMWCKADVDWQILTKRPARALSIVNSWGTLPDHIWFGVTCENQRRLDERLPILEQVNAELRWLSVEPMLGPVRIPSFDALSWVVVGAESGDNRRPFDKSWAQAVRDDCRAVGVPFFYKQGSGQRPGTDPYLDGRKEQEWPPACGAELQPALF